MVWLFSTQGVGDNGYEEFYQSVDTILMGRSTYEQILILEKGRWPYENKECFVASSSMGKGNEFVKVLKGDIQSVINSLKEKEGQNIWIVGGGELVHSLLPGRLVDELILTIAPSLLGNGIPLFRSHDEELALELKDMRRNNQFVQLHYSLKVK
ncbi:dihydrofolate reductase family protein [Bacillus sp. AK031]